MNQHILTVTRLAGTCALTLILTGCLPDALQDVPTLRALATQSLDQRNFADAVSRARRLVEKTPQDIEAHYLLAQALAQSGERTAALVALEQAIRQGLRDANRIEAEPRLEPLRDMNAYEDMMSAQFPDRLSVSVRAGSARASVSSGATTTSQRAGEAVSIEQRGGKQVVRAGDLVVELPPDR
ncbi:MAG: hypothetical protein RL654_1054 [Pseudomonadota bacterium]|jgi:DNA-binding SARP family transcriptional activator